MQKIEKLSKHTISLKIQALDAFTAKDSQSLF